MENDDHYMTHFVLHNDYMVEPEQAMLVLSGALHDIYQSRVILDQRSDREH